MPQHVDVLLLMSPVETSILSYSPSETRCFTNSLEVGVLSEKVIMHISSIEAAGLVERVNI